MKRNLLFCFQRFWLQWSCYWVDKNAVSWVSQERVDSCVQLKGTVGIRWILPFCHTASVVVVAQPVLCNLLFKVKISLYSALSPFPPSSWQNWDGQSHALVVLIKTVRLTVGISVPCSDEVSCAAKSSFLPCWLITEIISLWIWELEPGSSDYPK